MLWARFFVYVAKERQIVRNDGSLASKEKGNDLSILYFSHFFDSLEPIVHSFSMQEYTEIYKLNTLQMRNHCKHIELFFFFSNS